MANMSYCRFENTLRDLRDCYDALNDGALNKDFSSDEEEKAARRLISLCKKIGEEYADDVEIN